MTAGRTVYVAREGAMLRREGHRLQLVARRQRLGEVTTEGMSQLVLMGNIVLSPGAIDLLVDRGIDTVLLSHHGRYRGRIVSGISGNVRLRLAQYRACDDETRRRELARSVVAGKVVNQRVQLLRHARRHGETPALHAARVGLRAGLERIALAKTVDELRGCEGAASAAYFRVFGELIRAEGFRFEGRNRQPPLDPLNALLSLGYTLLSNVVEAAIHVVGLDPYLGALHAPMAGRPSLVCDLVEEFRAPVVDALVVSAFNQGAFTPGDFEEMGPGEPVTIRREALRWFVTLFERRMARPAHYVPEDRSLPRRTIVELQARRLARFFLDRQPYEPFRIR